jgi:hypothetical protein
MPEHAWWKEKNPADEPAWFYKMYGPGSDPATRAQVRWNRAGDTLSYEMEASGGFELGCSARLENDGVHIGYSIKSGGSPVFAAAAAVTCVKLYRPFTDVFLERTYVHVPEGLELIAADSPDRVEMNAEEWLPCRYIAQVAKGASVKPYRSERLNGVTRHFKAKSADMPFLATESHPGGWTACTHSLNADSVFINPARTCHHADPIALGILSGKAHLRLKAYFLRGNAQACYERVARQAALGSA